MLGAEPHGFWSLSCIAQSHSTVAVDEHSRRPGSSTVPEPPRPLHRDAPHLTSGARIVRVFKGLVMACICSLAVVPAAWSTTLSLGSVSQSSPGADVLLPLSLSSSGSLVAAVEWTVAYSTSDFVAVNLSAGPSATAAGKNLNCSSASAGQYTCLLTGLNQAVISDGVIANLALTLSSTTLSNSSTVTVTGPLTSDPSGGSLATTAAGSTVSIAPPGSTLSGLACSPASITVPNASTCTVTLAGAAPSTGTVVSLGYAASGASMTVPSSVTVPAGATQTTFSAQAVSANSTATVLIAATLSGISSQFSITVAPGQLVSTSTVDTIPPTAPANLTASAASSSKINLAWTASTDNVAVTGYLIERCQGPGCSNFVQIATTTGTTLANTGLPSHTMYSYRVRATDAAGNLSAYSNIVNARTRSK